MAAPKVTELNIIAILNHSTWMRRRLVSPKDDKRKTKIFILSVPVMARDATIKRQIVLVAQKIVANMAASARLKVPVRTA